MSAIEQLELARSELPATAYGATSPSRRGNVLLLVGLFGGIGLAASGVTSQPANAPPPALPPDAVAQVNGRVIRGADLESALKDAASLVGPAASATSDGRGEMLEAMIEEELLVQRGLELGLAHTDGRVRRELASAVATSVVVAANASDPGTEELRAYYETNRARLSNEVVLRVDQVWVAVGNIRSETESYEKAKEAERRWRRGEDVVILRSDIGDAEPIPIPDRPVSPSELSRHLDPASLNVVLSLAPGEISPPFRSPTGFHVFRLNERRVTGGQANFERTLPVVRSAYRQERVDRALASYVKELRGRAVIMTRDGAP